MPLVIRKPVRNRSARVARREGSPMRLKKSLICLLKNVKTIGTSINRNLAIMELASRMTMPSHRRNKQCRVVKR